MTAPHEDPAVIAFAHQQLRLFAQVVNGVINNPENPMDQMDAQQVRHAFDALQDVLNGLRKEVDRKACL